MGEGTNGTKMECSEKSVGEYKNKGGTFSSFSDYGLPIMNPKLPNTMSGMRC